MQLHRGLIVGILAMLALSAVLAGCDKAGNNSAPSPTASADSPSPSPTASQPSPSPTAKPDDNGQMVLEEFRGIVLADAPADELNVKLDKAMAGVAPETADELVRELESYYEKNLPEVEKKFNADNVQKTLLKLKWPFTADQTADIKDEKTRSLVEKTLAGGYKLETAEGYVFPILDYGALKRFDDRVTPGMVAFIALMALESDSKSAEDGGLIITWEELASRTLAAENYVRTYPQSKERVQAEQRFIQYLYSFLVGMDNTPIFQFETFKIDQKVKSTYEQTIQANPDTATAKMTQKLLDILKKTEGAVFLKGKNGEKLDIPEVKQFRESIKKEARSMLDQASPAS
ncbi:hypothetical protein [Gordoniibacillus kamchatkensis]|uniref:hypothetical protein n=1 Tax=Gordoniibacillus kamchatkensis TaxID=1590651 RepID=UPI000696EBA9|nr:hypothetical protein [Paenibacillus sp. VKM B-2647]